MLELLRRPEVTYAGLNGVREIDPEVGRQVEVEVKYAGYVERQRAEVERRRAQEDVRLPEDLDYAEIRGLSVEVRQKLALHRPETIGQAGKISGVTPAAVALLLVHLKKRASPNQKKTA